MPAPSSGRSEPPGGRKARSRRRDAGLLVSAPARLANPCAKGAGPRRRSRRRRQARATLAFVEVKARASDEDAAFALDEWRLRRVVVAAERLAPRYMREGDDVRIDAMFIVPRRWPRHLANIWQG